MLYYKMSLLYYKMNLLRQFNIGDIVSGFGIQADEYGHIICCKPDIVKVDEGEIMSRVKIRCITCKKNGGLYISPTELFSRDYGFKYDGENMLREVVNIKGAHLFFQKGQSKHEIPFLFCRYRYKLRPNVARIAALHSHVAYKYALVPKEWLITQPMNMSGDNDSLDNDSLDNDGSRIEDSFGGGSKKKRKSTKRKNKRRSTKRKSKQRKYKKTRRRK